MSRYLFSVQTTRKLVSLALATALVAPAAIWGGLAARTPPTTFLPGGAVPQSPPQTPEIQGIPRVLDGDTIEIAGTRIRLEGIDAPEGDQSCARAGGGTWSCGKVATVELERLIGRSAVTCASRGTDKYGRMLGICRAHGMDLNAEMIRRGLAWAFVKYSSSYVTDEAGARARRVGIWQAPTVTAWDHRAGRWADAEGAAPRDAPSRDCIIKGNITSNGRIYHMPWSPWYGKVRIETGKGERWFCTESEAVAAGWRPVHVN